MLSPSVPPGRCSMSNVTFGCSAENAAVTPAVNNDVVWVLSASSFNVTLSPLFSSAGAAALPGGSVGAVDAAAGDTTPKANVIARPPATATAVLNPFVMLKPPPTANGHGN